MRGSWGGFTWQDGIACVGMLGHGSSVYEGVTDGTNRDARLLYLSSKAVEESLYRMFGGSIWNILKKRFRISSVSFLFFFFQASKCVDKNISTVIQGHLMWGIKKKNQRLDVWCGYMAQCKAEVYHNESVTQNSVSQCVFFLLYHSNLPMLTRFSY